MELVKRLFGLFALLILITGIFVPKSAHSITIKEEEELAREMMKVVKQHFRLVKDPLIVDYVNDVGQKIVSAFPPQPFEYHFYVIKEHVYNAFAGPGGHIFINSGLVAAMENENELAGILGHEIAHVSCRHISQKIERSSKIGLATLAGIAAGLFLGAGGAGAAAEALAVGSMAAGQSLSLAYTRENERQADQVGLKYLIKAGYSPEGILTMLKKIRGKQWFGSDVVPVYVTTHPALEERIAYIEARNTKHQTTKHQTPDNQTSNTRFRKVHACLTAIYGDEGVALNRFGGEILKHPDDPVVCYGYGLILARTGARDEAIFYLKKALAKEVFDPYILRDLGITYFLDGQYNESLRTLEGAVSIKPADPEGLFFLGRARMELKQFEGAAAAFEDLLEKHPDTRQALYFLGEAYGRMNDLGKAHYNLGLYYKGKDFKNARFHLKRSLKYITDPSKKAEIEGMLKELRIKNRDKKSEKIGP